MSTDAIPFIVFSVGMIGMLIYILRLYRKDGSDKWTQQ